MKIRNYSFRHLALAAVIMLSTAVAFVGCKTAKSTSQVQNTTQKEVRNISDDIKTINSILYGEWMVANVNGQAVIGDDRPYVVFDKEATNPFLAKFYAYNGCNVLNGRVAIEPSGTMKKAGDYAATMKYCADAAYEIGVTMTLENISKFHIEKIGEEYLLYLTGANKQQTMILRKSDIDFINGAWAVTRIGDRVLDQGDDIMMVIDIPEMKVHGNAGCNVFNGSLFIDQDLQHSLQFKDCVTTRMTCPKIALEQEFLANLARVTTVERDHSDNAAVLRDKEGTLLMELKRVNLTEQTE